MQIKVDLEPVMNGFIAIQKQQNVRGGKIRIYIRKPLKKTHNLIKHKKQEPKTNENIF